tara:strand:+ start:243 stop:533 length:291 start_codon:yes stop_codon:yes gene_type:complete
MSEKTLTRLDISDVINSEIGISRSESVYFVDTIVNESVNALVNNKILKISSFGTLKIRYKKSRVGRNPKTGQEVMISQRNIVSFIPSKILKNKMNK